MIVYDAAGVKTAISPDGSGSVYDAQGRRVSASSVASRLYSFDNPPASPSAYDDEFDTTTINAKWTIGSTATTNPIASGSVGILSSLTTPVYDLATAPSWLLIQSDNSSGGVCYAQQSITLASSCTLFVHLGTNNRAYNAATKGNVSVRLFNAADTNESIYFEFGNLTGAGMAYNLAVENNGVFTLSSSGVVGEGNPLPNPYLALWKSTDTYTLGIALGATFPVFTTLASVTKTGVTTLDTVRLQMLTASETPSFIGGFDFFRYYGSVTYALRNQAL